MALNLDELKHSANMLVHYGCMSGAVKAEIIDPLIEENKLLREALKFYASIENWTEGDLHRIEYPEVLVSVVEKDGGHKARQALGI